ncbi:RING/U-box superfamily protein [Raphanus sativus]|uniref:RING-type E3 ubiquitin transferase n=1 Tax=Raphanus sativus TaxID=3726 RepID=A0A6J0MAP7_RAPSA|nr:E3 ubiquitin-protein ligase AIRP1-like [Raphanus sativus]XP_056859148.1 E3 ubiquitin-protein ligase AIRP1-like [Raphanus sativus]KAJ4912966.1 RING/U-box superfamily protein [Raphanus sativus]
MGWCCCCFPIIPESSRTIDEHVPLSRAPPSSVVPTEAVNRNLASTLYTAPLQPPLPVSFSPRNLQIPSKLSTTQTQSNSSEGSRGITTNSVPQKETWPADDFADNDLKKKNRETIDECPICLEEYHIDNPKLLTKCGHNFHLACILEWMERSEACPVCDKELVLTES